MERRGMKLEDRRNEKERKDIMDGDTRNNLGQKCERKQWRLREKGWKTGQRRKRNKRTGTNGRVTEERWMARVR